MKYNKINIAWSSGKANYYLPAINRYLLKEWVDSAWEFKEGFGRLVKGHKWNYVRRDGTFLLNEWIDFAGDFHGGLGNVYKNRKWNYIKPEGTILLEEWVVFDFNNGFGLIRKGDKKYNVDKEGNLYEI